MSESINHPDVDVDAHVNVAMQHAQQTLQEIQKSDPTSSPSYHLTHQHASHIDNLMSSSSHIPTDAQIMDWLRQQHVHSKSMSQSQSQTQTRRRSTSRSRSPVRAGPDSTQESSAHPTTASTSGRSSPTSHVQPQSSASVFESTHESTSHASSRPRSPSPSSSSSSSSQSVADHAHVESNQHKRVSSPLPAPTSTETFNRTRIPTPTSSLAPVPTTTTTPAPAPAPPTTPAPHYPTLPPSTNTIDSSTDEPVYTSYVPVPAPKKMQQSQLQSQPQLQPQSQSQSQLQLQSQPLSQPHMHFQSHIPHHIQQQSHPAHQSPYPFQSYMVPQAMQYPSQFQPPQQQQHVHPPNVSIPTQPISHPSPALANILGRLLSNPTTDMMLDDDDTATAWRSCTDWIDLLITHICYLYGHLTSCPTYYGTLNSESVSLIPLLAYLITCGFFTTSSQPAVSISAHNIHYGRSGVSQRTYVAAWTTSDIAMIIKTQSSIWKDANIHVCIFPPMSAKTIRCCIHDGECVLNVTRIHNAMESTKSSTTWSSTSFLAKQHMGGDGIYHGHDWDGMQHTLSHSLCEWMYQRCWYVVLIDMEWGRPNQMWSMLHDILQQSHIIPHPDVQRIHDMFRTTA